MKTGAITLIVLALGVSNVCVASGSHGAATAAPTYGGDNTSAPTSAHKGGFHHKHKKAPKPKSPPPASQ